MLDRSTTTTNFPLTMLLNLCGHVTSFSVLGVSRLGLHRPIDNATVAIPGDFAKGLVLVSNIVIKSRNMVNCEGQPMIAQ